MADASGLPASHAHTFPFYLKGEADREKWVFLTYWSHV